MAKKKTIKDVEAEEKVTEVEETEIEEVEEDTKEVEETEVEEIEEDEVDLESDDDDEDEDEDEDEDDEDKKELDKKDKEDKKKEKEEKKKDKEKNKKDGYFKSIGKELKKVVWPSAGEVVKYSLAVIVFCLILVIFFVGIDALASFIKGLF